MEETIGYEDEFPGLPYREFFSPDEWASICAPRKASLSDDDALQIARSLEDYTHVTVTDLGGSNEYGFWLVVRNEVTETTSEINAWQDYWDFVVAFLSGKQQLRTNAQVLSSGVAELGLGGAAAGNAAPEEIHPNKFSAAGSPAPAAAAG